MINVKVLKDYIIGLQHIGHIVPDLGAAVDAFRNVYGLDEAAVHRVPESQTAEAPVLFAFVTVGDTEFELIQPVAREAREQLLASPAGGAGINHVAWQVTDIEACLELLAVQGVKPGHVTPDGIVETGRSRIVYLDPQDTGELLIELVERAGGP